MAHRRCWSFEKLHIFWENLCLTFRDILGSEKTARDDKKQTESLQNRKLYWFLTNKWYKTTSSDIKQLMGTERVNIDGVIRGRKLERWVTHTSNNEDVIVSGSG